MSQRDMHNFPWIGLGGRHASRNIAETLRCGFFIAKNLDCVQYCSYEKHCNKNASNVVSCTITLEGICRRYWWWSEKNEDTMIACLTYAWQVLDICLTILTFTLCIWKACRRLKQNSQDCQAFLFAMMLLSFVSEEVYFPCLAFVELLLIECTKPCFEWR